MYINIIPILLLILILVIIVVILIYRCILSTQYYTSLLFVYNTLEPDIKPGDDYNHYSLQSRKFIYLSAISTPPGKFEKGLANPNKNVLNIYFIIKIICCM